MAERVWHAIENRRHIVVQAGTGIGKSLAYLLPAAKSGRRVVVATATKALQDQLADKDLPFLASQLGPRRDLTFAVLKGRSNYLCRQRALEVRGGGGGLPNQPLGDPSVSENPWDTGDGESQAGSSFASQVKRILAWAERSATGDRADLDFEPGPRAWSALSVSARECPGAFRCPSGASCFAERARALAAAADVVIVNTHLYATHVASGGAVLPEHDILIFDEAHAVEDVMTAGLGVELSPGRLRAIAAASRGLLRPEDAGLAEGVSEIAERLDRLLRPLVGKRVLRTRASGRDLPAIDETRSGGALRTGAGADEGANEGADELNHVLRLAHSRIEALSRALRRAREADDEGARHVRALLAAGSLVEDVSALENPGDDDVAWVETDGSPGRTPVLRLAPIEVGPLLAERVWPEVSAVLTSATIPPQLDKRLGLPEEETERVDVGSPYPYRDCTLLYCPTDLPDRRRPDSDSAVHEELHRLIVAAGGRTLALFTSWRSMRAAVESLRPRLEFELFSQNDLPKPKLVQAFSAEQSSCLFATMSFWQGVDIPGPTLSVVAIDRLPFPRPDDPLLEARRERAGGGAFGIVDLPRAATLLAQGAGRLIRSSKDSGMVAVLDRRLATASYGRALRSSLPPMRFTTKRSEAMEFLRSIERVAPEEGLLAASELTPGPDQ
jgi:ATP-dependent DNA helicase DinG